MLVKIHKSINGIVVAICDKELIDKKFEQGKLQLDLTTDFYNGEEKSEEETKEILKKAYIVNLVGKKAVDFGLKNKIINKENIKKIAKIPFCQCLIAQT